MSGGIRLGLLEHPLRRLNDVLQGCHVLEQVEVLEDHADLGPLAAHLAVLQLVEPAALLPVAHEFSAY